MQSTRFNIYGIILACLFLVFVLYQVKSSQRTTSKASAEADYLINDQQEYFKTNSSISPSSCQCPSFSGLTHNQTFVEHGENTPVFVPETMPSIPQDILDKLEANTYEDKSVIITIAGYTTRKELYNWMELMKAAKEDQFVVFCMDPKLYLHLVVTGHEEKAVLIPEEWFVNDSVLFRNSTELLLDEARLSHVKTWVLQRLAYRQDRHTLMLDTNQVMLHARTREYMHTLLHMREDTQIIATQDSPQTVNTGLVFLRSDPSQEVKRLLASTVQIQEAYPSLKQQEAFNYALNQSRLDVKAGMLVLLDMIHFPNYFDLKKVKGIQPYIVHVNHKTDQERINALKKHDFWKINDDFVDGASRQVEEMYARQRQRLEQYNE